MTIKPTLKYVNVDDLKLDPSNPRFGELYNGSTGEEDLIEYLLYEEAAEEIAAAIVKKGEFYEDKALWVIKDTEGKYIVRDGNRRCAAVKALQLPTKYKLSLPKTLFNQLPVYEYTDEKELKARISEEHAASLFRSWERIAKALQILDLVDSGKDDEANNLDSKPGDFIKLGSFYKEAVKYGDDDFRKQLRRGRGKTGGKTIIYERLFRDASICGYRFKRGPNHRIEITDQQKFEDYIRALVLYIESHPEIKTSDIDENKDFIRKLKDYGFDAYPPVPPTATSNPAPRVIPSTTGSNPGGGGPVATTTGTSTGGGSPTINPGGSSVPPAPISPTPAIKPRHSTKRKPDLNRKKISPALKKLIDECFDISKDNFPNAKTALTRVTFECTLKYIVENTDGNPGKLLKNSNHFKDAYFNKKTSTKLPYTNFTILKNKFTELISDTGIKKAFGNFDLERPHQIIHNYHTVSSPTDAETICINLMPLIEFMLRAESDLLKDLDVSKL